MSFPRYAKYKDSGAEWLGDVPAHWDVTRVRWLFEIRKRIAGELGFDVLSITQQGFRVKDVESNEGQVSLDYSKYQLVEVGDFAMNHMDLITGGVDIAQNRGVTSPDYRVFSIRDRLKVHDRYFLYLFQNCLRERIFFAYGQGSSQLGRWRFPADNFKDFRFPAPPAVEQEAITEFLDREIAKLDALVEEQRRLIELLKEKRQAVISHAVTKGLNPHASMKPSGIEWLGNVPEHWTRSQPKHFTVKIVDGVHFKPNYLSEGIPFITVQNLTAGPGISFDDLNYISEQDHEQFFRRTNPEKGDVLLTKDGATLGVARVVETDEIFSIFVSVALLKPNLKLVDSWFLCYALESSVVFQQFKAGEQGSALKHIHLVDLRNVFVAVPPITEQRQIVDWLNETVGRLASLEREAERAIQLLQERRTALISAAVTGKIDVRGLAESEAA